MRHDIIQSALHTMLGRADRLAEGHRPDALGHTKELLRAVEQVQAVDTEAQRDVNLSDVGRRDRIAQVAKKSVNLTPLKNLRTKTAGERTRLETELFSLPARRGGIEERMDEQEIRQVANGKTQGEIVKMFREALASGNHTAARALTQGPLGSLLPGDVAARLLQSHAEAVQPEAFSRLQSLVEFDAHLAAVEELAQNWVRELTGGNNG